MTTIPDRIPSHRFEKLVGAFDLLGEMMIQMELEFDHELDADRLAQAMDLTLDAEPVLGCYYVGRFFRGHWRRLNPDERDCCTVVNKQADFDRFKQAPINGDKGPQLRCCLLRHSDGDRLLFKFSHLVGDAGGTKMAVARVAEIYLRLRDDPEYKPEPNINGSRMLAQVFKRLPLSALPRIWLNARREARRTGKPRLTRAFRLLDEHGEVVRTNEPVYLTRVLTTSQVQGMSELGRRCGGKINDVVVAAFMRTLAKLVPGQPGDQLRLQTTVDLRTWYLPEARAGGICNLSSFENPNLGEDPGPDFKTTLKRVADFTRERKSNWVGLSTFLGETGLLMMIPRRPLNRIFRKISHIDNSRNLLTNGGPIEPDAVTFDHPPKVAYLMTPPLYAPAPGFGLSGYNGQITLITAVPESFVSATDEFLDGIVAELDTGIRENTQEATSSEHQREHETA